MRNLILLTTHYPHGENKETFLETEILFLSKKFDKITLVSTNPDSELQRTVPSNVVVYKFPSVNYFGRSLSVLIKNISLILSIVRPEILNVLKFRDRLVFERLKLLAKHIIKALMIRDYILSLGVIPQEQTVIYSYWFNSAALACGLVKMAKPDVRIISRLHNWDLYSENHQTNYFPFQRLKANLLDKCYFISEQGKSYFERKYGMNKNYIVSRLGVVNIEMHRKEFQAQSDLNTFHIVSCSYLNKGKRIDRIIESLALIDEIMVSWTHLGGGDLYQELYDLAFIKLGSKKNIAFNFIGNISNEQVLQFYKNNYIHLFINTSVSEGLPVSIMEAMSFGIPVIATNAGGTAEIVNGTCGALLDVNCTFLEIKEGILKIYYEYSNHSFRKNAFENWLKNYNAEINYTDFSKQISEMI